MDVHGVSYTSTDPGIALLHHFEQINILDVDGVTDYVRRHQIEYVYSVGSDIAMPTVAQAARRTGLNCFIDPETAEICCCKPRMRRALAGCPGQVEYAVCRHPAQVREITFYPAMMKPADSQGQRGVFLCRDAAEAMAHFARSMGYSRCGEVILERYIPGDEVSFNGYVREGELIFGLMSDREVFSEYPGGIVKGHRLPSRFAGTDTEKAVRTLVQDTLIRLRILNGPVYFQIMIHHGQPHLLEVTPRLDGCHMWQLIRLYTGVDLLDMTLSHLLEGHVEAPVWQPLVRAARTEFTCRAPGTVFTPETAPPAAISRDYYRAGETVSPINGHMEKCGYRMDTEPFRIALVGGSSMIGRRFARMYGNRYALTDISRSTGAVQAYRQEEISPLLSGCDAAVILAAKKYRGPAEDHTVNRRITEETFHACHAAGVKQIIFLSTRCVYDPQGTAPFAEDAALRPINAYGASKLEAEQVLLSLAEKYGIRACVLRLAQVLSPEDTTTAFHAFLTQAMQGKPLTVYGTGQGRRDYIHISYVCRAIDLALRSREASGVYNIGSDSAVSIAELARTVAEASGTGAQVILRPDLPEDASVCCLDISRARRELHFEPEHDLRSAVEQCLRSLNGSEADT